MKFYNFRFNRLNGISTAHWSSPSMNTWRQERLPFIEFQFYVRFPLTHSGFYTPEFLGQYNRLKLRIGNHNLILFFGFGKEELAVYGTGVGNPIWKSGKKIEIGVAEVGENVRFGADFATKELDRSRYTLWRSCGDTVKEAQEGATALAKLSNGLCKDNGELDD